MYTDLGAPLSTEVLATDASGGDSPGLGAAEAVVDPVWVGNVYRKAEGRGAYTKLATSFDL